jgi:hypothetical protein
VKNSSLNESDNESESDFSYDSESEEAAHPQLDFDFNPKKRVTREDEQAINEIQTKKAKFQ